MRRFFPVALVASAGVLLLPAPSASAQGPPIVNETNHLVNEAEVQVGVFPCTGQLAELTLVESGVIHITVFSNGTVHFTGTLHGTFSVDALPTDGIPDITGAFVEKFNGNGMVLEGGGAIGKGESSFILNGSVTTVDGSAFGVHQNGMPSSTRRACRSSTSPSWAAGKGLGRRSRDGSDRQPAPR